MGVGQPKDGGEASLKNDFARWTFGAHTTQDNVSPSDKSQFAIKSGQWERISHQIEK